MSETIVLDPSEVAATGRTQLDITGYIAADTGVDWGDAAMASYVAELSVGSTTVDYRIPNRTITIALVIKSTASATFADTRQAIQTKVAEIQGAGGTGKRIDSGGGIVFFDIVSAQLKLGGGWTQAYRDVDLEATLTLEALPDFYGEEESLSDHSTSTAAELIFTETTASGGDFPLGDRCRIVVDDDASQNQRGLFWHWRGRHYSADSTAASAIEAESLGLQDTATRVAKTGASNGTVVTHGTVLTDTWTPVTLGTFTHTGTNRVRARVFSDGGTAIQTRMIWSTGDLTSPVENEGVTLSSGGTFQLVDYGEVRFRPPQAGDHGWQGQFQARATSGTVLGFSMDRLWFQNVDESAGVLNATAGAIATNPTTYTGRDAFTQGTAALNGLTAQVGGAWDTSETSFDATDFTVSGSTTFIVARAEVSDGANAGRPALLGSAVTGCGVQADMKFSVALGATLRLGVLARYTDISNYLLAAVVPGGGGADLSNSQIVVSKRVAGTNTTLGSSGGSLYWGVVATWYTLRLTVDSAGSWVVSVWIAGTFVGVAASGQDPALATGGALASGKVGFYDENTAALVSVRNYDNFLSWSPGENVVVFSSQSAELSSVGMAREDSTGTLWTPVPGVTGDLPRMPNRSSGGTAEFMVKGSRGDFQTLNDPAIDAISARVHRRPCYLLVP